MSEEKQPPQIPDVEVIDGGRWENGKFIAPEGWPEGAGWVVLDGPGGKPVKWGPASDFALVATTDLGNGGPMPPASDLSAALKGLPQPAEPEEPGE